VQMRQLDDAAGPDVRLAFARSSGGATDKLAKLNAPAVRLAVVKALGRGELMVN
jgi:hypothetical protein